MTYVDVDIVQPYTSSTHSYISTYVHILLAVQTADACTPPTDIMSAQPYSMTKSSISQYINQESQQVALSVDIDRNKRTEGSR